MYVPLCLSDDASVPERPGSQRGRRIFTYLRNVLPHLSARGDVQVTAALNPQLRGEFSGLPCVSLPEIDVPAGALGRFWKEQTSLPSAIRQCGAKVLVSAGNFARQSPCRKFCFREIRSTPRKIFFTICAAVGILVCGWIPGSRAAWPGVPSAGRTAPWLRPRLLPRSYGSGADTA